MSNPSAGPSFAELVSAFAKIGVLSFGGPAGQIALMHKIVVDEKKWLDEPRFLSALNFCMLLPGPEAMQLATYIGWLTHGVKGGIATGLLFILPGAAVLIALSALYFFFGGLPLVAGLLFGLKAAVVALVLEALLRVARRALKAWHHWVIAALALVALSIFSVPFPLVVLAAGVAGFVIGSPAKPADTATPPAAIVPSWGSALAMAVAGLAVWFAPLTVIAALGGMDGVFADLATFFAQAAIVTFGGAYAVLAYVGDVAVSQFKWLEPREMVTGLGLAETTPGPLILVLLFVGFLAGARLGGLDPALGGVLGALVTLWFTFVPSFIMIFLGAPHVERIRAMPRLSGALSGITAAVVGVIASLGLWFAVTLFWPMGIAPLPDMLKYFDGWAIAIAVAAGVALLRFHIGLGWVLAAAAVAGAGLKLAGLA
ncbi:MAG: chromate efflux transporter [Rhizobiaceae bacterium]|jgi:chromate transporter|nr:chromate efflux transporter [Rhizobiaceae bacterium]